MGKQKKKGTATLKPAPITARDLDGYAEQLVKDGRASTSILGWTLTKPPRSNRPTAGGQPKPRGEQRPRARTRDAAESIER